MIGPVDTPHEFIFVPDLAETLVALSEKPEAYGQAWNVQAQGSSPPGNSPISSSAPFIRSPASARRANSCLRVMGLFNPFMREVRRDALSLDHARQTGRHSFA